MIVLLALFGYMRDIHLVSAQILYGNYQTQCDTYLDSSDVASTRYEKIVEPSISDRIQIIKKIKGKPYSYHKKRAIARYDMLLTKSFEKSPFMSKDKEWIRSCICASMDRADISMSFCGQESDYYHDEKDAKIIRIFGTADWSTHPNINAFTYKSKKMGHMSADDKLSDILGIQTTYKEDTQDEQTISSDDYLDESSSEEYIWSDEDWYNSSQDDEDQYIWQEDKYISQEDSEEYNVWEDQYLQDEDSDVSQDSQWYGDDTIPSDYYRTVPSPSTTSSSTSSSTSTRPLPSTSTGFTTLNTTASSSYSYKYQQPLSLR